MTMFPSIDFLVDSLNHLRHEHHREADKRRLVRLARHRAGDTVESLEPGRNAGKRIRTVNERP
ncbi:MAG TPA: hypothetical protein VD767_03885 [Thermomicrobiales bacterium]|nr:hypothetical protein [Thermomicrobiales bacterium]